MDSFFTAEREGYYKVAITLRVMKPNTLLLNACPLIEPADAAGSVRCDSPHW